MKCSLFDGVRNADVVLDLTQAEAELVKLFVREIRHAAALKTQLLLTIDPWSTGGGCNFFASYNETGISQTIEGAIRARAIRGRKKAR
jgi:hypothetical protein